jgi:hypothetical protein
MNSHLIASANKEICLTGLTSYTSTNGFGTPSGACSSGSYPNTYYHDGGGAYPEDTDIIYTSSRGCSPLDGQDNYYFGNGDSGYIQISASGVVSNKTKCP